MKTDKIIALSLTASSILCANETIKLNEITTISTATKTEKNIDGVAASVEVITEKEIQKMGAESLKDVLNNAAGINMQYGSFPSASSKSKSSLSIRGMGQKGTLFLLDGRRLSGEVANPYDLDRIPANQIEKIEIVKGPMSTLYGADAVGGVVNIITKKPKNGKPEVDFGVRYGQNSDGDDQNKNINLGIRGKEKSVGYSFYINKTETTPYTQKENADVYAKLNSSTKVKPSSHAHPQLKINLKDAYNNEEVTYKEESDILTYGGRLEYDFSDKVTAGFEFNKFNEERSGKYIGYFHPTKYGTPPNLIPAYNVPVVSTDTNNRLDMGADLKIAATDSLSLKLKAYQSKYKKRNATIAKYWTNMGYASEEASAQNGMDADVDIKSYEATANYALNPSHLLTGGVELRNENRDSSVFSQANSMSRKSVDYKALYLQDEWMIDDSLNAIIGGRYDDISNADSKATFNAGVVKNFSKEFNLRANIAQGYRTPDIRELYIFKNTAASMQRGADTIDTTLGKTAYDLKPESTLTYELGANGRRGDTTYDIAIFYNNIEDMISETNKKAYITFENVPKANTYGGELNVKQKISDNFELYFNWAELRTKNKQTDKELEFNPDRIVSLRATYAINKGLDMSIGAKYVGEQYFRETVNRGIPTEIIKDSSTNSYTTLDWNINYEYSKWLSIYGGINNLNDEKIDDVLGSSSGRYYFAGLKVRF